MLLYFAYGSNMNRAMMARRCPTAEPVGAGRLDGWRYIISGDGYASIVPAAGAVVHGALWRLKPRDLAALNIYECLDSGLYRRRMLTVRAGSRRVSALTYVGRGRRAGRPRPGYQEAALPAAKTWALPEPYLRELRRWSYGIRATDPRSRSSPRKRGPSTAPLVTLGPRFRGDERRAYPSNFISAAPAQHILEPAP